MRLKSLKRALFVHFGNIGLRVEKDDKTEIPMMGVPPNIFQALTLIKMNYLQVENKCNLKPIGLKLTHIARNERYEKPFSCTDPKILP